jgi:biopolymer transport protein ExbD
MAKVAHGYDLWLTATNRVYRGVPYDVLTDWLQQGRVVADDRLRPEGGSDWTPVSALPAFAAFLPHAEAAKAEDTAGALEPVELPVVIRRRPGEEDDDVDMIPLIDISLVLLIFFMMTATVAVSGADIPTPQTYHGVELSSDQDMVWVGVNRTDFGTPAYSIGQGNRPAEPGEDSLTLPQVLERLDAKLKAAGRGCVVRVAGHKKLPYGVVQQLNAELEKRRRPAGGGIIEIKAEVNERSS